MKKIVAGAKVLAISEQGLGKVTDEEEYRLQNRGGKGVSTMMISEKTGALVALHIVMGEEDVMIIRADGTIIRMRVNEIREVSRHTQGVKLMQVSDEAMVVSAEIVPHDDSEDEEAAENAENTVPEETGVTAERKADGIDIAELADTLIAEEEQKE